jgi:hypothetical protein
MKQGQCICHSAGAYTATLLVMVNVMKGGGRAAVHPPPSPTWANFTLMMEFTPESSRYYSVYSVVPLTKLQALYRLNFMPPSASCFQMASQKTRWRSKLLKGSRRMGGGPIFPETFNDDLSNKPIFSQINLAVPDVLKNLEGR